MRSRGRPWRYTAISAILTPVEIDRLAARFAMAGFRPAVDRLQRDVQDFLDLKLHIPDLPGGYYHDYICPTHGTELVFRAAVRGCTNVPSTIRSSKATDSMRPGAGS